MGDGEFFCPGCGGDRNYRRRTGRRRFTLFGLPLLPRGQAGPVVECVACQDRFGTECLDHPTTVRFSAMLKDAVHTVVLAVLVAGGTSSRTVLAAAVGSVRSAGFGECTQDQLTTLVDALAADTGRLLGADADAGADADERAGVSLAIELHEALDPLAPHLAPAGRESILLQAAGVAIADGPYTPAEHEVLMTVGRALTLGADEVEQLLAAARTPS